MSYSGDTLAGYNVWVALLDQRAMVSVELVFFLSESGFFTGHEEFCSSRAMLQGQEVKPALLVSEVIYPSWLCGAAGAFIR